MQVQIRQSRADKSVLLDLREQLLTVQKCLTRTETHRPDEGAKVQALNDFLVFGTTVATSLSAGAVFNIYGWSTINILVILPVVLAIAAVVLASRRRVVAAS